MAISPANSTPGKPRPVVEEISTQTYPLNRPSDTVKTTKSYSEQNPSYFNIDLPSNFKPYSFTSVSACNLKGSHQAKLARAAKEDKIRFVVEAIGATIEPTVSAFDLVPADFYFVMYWQRVNSYKNMPLIVTATCENPTHVNSVYNGDTSIVDGADVLIYKKPESLNNTIVLNSTTLEVKQLDDIDMSPFESIVDLGLGYETMRDVVESTEYLERLLDSATKVKSHEPEEYVWLAAKAAFLTKDRSLADRIKIIENLEPERNKLLDDYITAVTSYGVSETAKFQCKECGGWTEVKLSLNPLTFL